MRQFTRPSGSLQLAVTYPTVGILIAIHQRAIDMLGLLRRLTVEPQLQALRPWLGVLDTQPWRVEHAADHHADRERQAASPTPQNASANAAVDLLAA